MDKYPGLVVRTIKRLGIGAVDQVYYASKPSGGIRVSEELIAAARAAGDLQRRSDERFNNRNKEQSLGMVVHSFAHVIAMDFMGFGKIPYEYCRKA